MHTMIVRALSSLVLISFAVGHANASPDQQHYTLEEVAAMPEMQTFAQEIGISTNTLKVILPIMIEHRRAISSVEAVQVSSRSREFRRQNHVRQKELRRINKAATRKMRAHLSNAQTLKWRKVAGISSRPSMHRRSAIVHNLPSGSSAGGGAMTSGRYEPANHGLKYW